MTFQKEVPQSLDDLPDKPDTDEDKPVVVVLKDGDLTQEEADEVLQETRLKGVEDEDDEDQGNVSE